jgi:hypothetical protein
MVRHSNQVFSTLFVLGSFLVPAVARAQSESPRLEPVITKQPSLIVSVAASPMGLDDWRRSDGPALVGSVQARLSRILFLEGEATRWTVVDDFETSDHDREALTIGANLLIRTGTSRVTGFFGGGLGVRVGREASSSTFTICAPGPGRSSFCTGETISQSRHQTETSLSPQFLVGGEFWVTRRLAAYGGARFAFGADSSRSTAGLAPLAGVRVALRTTDVAPQPSRFPDSNRAVGKDVRVTLNDGTTVRGKLEALSASEVTFKGTVIPLADVRRVEKVGHATRNAAVIGLLAGVPTLLILGPAADMGGDMALTIVAAGVGGGIAVGAVLDAAHKPGHVLYAAPGTSVSFTVRPMLARDRKGVAFAASW